MDGAAAVVRSVPTRGHRPRARPHPASRGPADRHEQHLGGCMVVRLCRLWGAAGKRDRLGSLSVRQQHAGRVRTSLGPEFRPESCPAVHALCRMQCTRSARNAPHPPSVSLFIACCVALAIPTSNQIKFKIPFVCVFRYWSRRARQAYWAATSFTDSNFGVLMQVCTVRCSGYFPTPIDLHAYTCGDRERNTVPRHANPIPANHGSTLDM